MFSEESLEKIKFRAVPKRVGLRILSLESVDHVDVISLEKRSLNFRVFIHPHSLRPQRYFRSSLTRVLNQFIKQIKSIDVDKIGSKKTVRI